MLNFFWRMLKNRKGFTLIELMVVVVVLGILATLAVQQLGDQSGKAKISKVKADLKTIASAAEIYKVNTGDYPNSITNLITAYLKKWPESPVAGQSYAWDPTNDVAVLCGDTNGNGALDSGETVYQFTTPESFVCSSANL
ncbi:prepilin-type N-terminal cleavage/methylation domain-containing protein [Thermanaerosceptrum fracticalcis]|uniref:Prepilin-type N-terminal cleavage/methylation domain-containing protein n=1 Tax=Thermanaerosceptrum fracticalcis TaxID=1712410 RepID=A0A7G6E877_THEFR|nr:prepilin-type N-terminal cleavage/methylation domain-containing protein [Thermanaerosceptrum fracticalcis]QNB48281.1 prepilin-type N-terminal cleavage/methylation domain-containing protein [Thermanaerosceptrum fracticalcis]